MKTEELFALEAQLRTAARQYVANTNDDTRKALRLAAVRYARCADVIDEKG